MKPQLPNEAPAKVDSKLDYAGPDTDPNRFDYLSGAMRDAFAAIITPFAAMLVWNPR